MLKKCWYTPLIEVEAFSPEMKGHDLYACSDFALLHVSNICLLFQNST